MNRMTTQSIKAKQNKWWLKMHFLFSMFIVSQFYTFDHQIEHLTDLNDRECVQCLVSNDYFESAHNDARINDALPDSIYTFNFGQSIPTKSPEYYSSRAPPAII